MKIFLLLLSFFTYPLMANEITPQRQQTVVIMLGAPGSGKGTQAVQLSQSLHLVHISTGDLFRENVKNGTPLGLQVQQTLSRGELVPDSLVLDMLFERLEQPDAKTGYILDGFPRTLAQAEALHARLSDHICLIAISLHVPDDLIVERISGRRVCEKCGAPYHIHYAPPLKEGICDRCQSALIQRKDDVEAIIRKRLLTYHQETEPLEQLYQKKAHYFAIDGTQSPQKILKEIEEDVHKACS